MNLGDLALHKVKGVGDTGVELLEPIPTIHFQLSEPSSPDVGDLWIPRDGAPVGSIALLPELMRNGEGETAIQNGDFWLVSFTTRRHGGTSAKMYDDGTIKLYIGKKFVCALEGIGELEWITYPVYEWDGEGWERNQNLDDMYLYHFGDEYWRFIVGYGDYETILRDEYNLRNTVSSWAFSWVERTYVTHKPIDVTDFEYVRARVNRYRSDSNFETGPVEWYFCVSTVQQGDYDTYDARTGGTISIGEETTANLSIDVSEMAGEYYLRSHIRARGSDSQNYRASGVIRILRAQLEYTEE